MKHTSRLKISVFWEYVIMCALVIVISCIFIGGIIGKAYIRSVNSHRMSTLQSQANHAVKDLDNQIDAMHALSLKLSIQYIYQRSYFEANPINEISVSTSLSQYSSYADLAAEFALMYRTDDSSFKVFLSSGDTSDLSVFLSRYGMETSPELLSFIFDSTESGRTMQMCWLLSFYLIISPFFILIMPLPALGISPFSAQRA